jgi:hypothetical protein
MNKNTGFKNHKYQTCNLKKNTYIQKIKLCKKRKNFLDLLYITVNRDDTGAMSTLD